jgi:acetamidase/formamidase
MATKKKAGEATVNVELLTKNILRVPIMECKQDEGVEKWAKVDEVLLMPGMNTITQRQLRAITENDAVRTRYLDKGRIAVRA